MAAKASWQKQLPLTVADMRREKIPNLKIEKDFLLSYIRC